MEEKRGGMKRKGERKRERKEDLAASSSDFWRFDSWSLLGRELKSV